MSICNGFYGSNKLINHINGINFIFDNCGNLLSYRPGVNQAAMKSGF